MTKNTERNLGQLEGYGAASDDLFYVIADMQRSDEPLSMDQLILLTERFGLKRRAYCEQR